MPSVRARGTERQQEGVGEHKCCTGSPSGGSTGFTAVYWAVLGAAVQWICPAYQAGGGVEVGVDINVRVCQSGQSLHVGNCIKPTDRTDGRTDTGGRLATVVSPSLPLLPLLHATAIISKCLKSEKPKVLRGNQVW